MKKITSLFLLAGMLVLLAGVAAAVPTTYTVTVNPIAYGSVSAGASSAAKDATVSVLAVPADGYVLALLTITRADGTAVSYKTLSEASYTFTMPASNVTISATFVLSGSGSGTAASGFKDVAKTDWFYDAVEYVSDKELMTGSNGSFDPQGTMTRGMTAMILYRLAGRPGLVGQPNYSDVAPGSTYASAVLWATQNAITNGYGDGRFGVDDPVDREQLVTFLYRYAKLKNCDVSAAAGLSSFADASTVQSYALAPMQWAVAKEIIHGDAACLTPLSRATRAQSAAIFMRFCKTCLK